MIEETLYFIDLDWYQQSGRSFNALVQSRLCPSCRQKEGDAITLIRDCCSKSEDFITPNMPILEAAFRLLLSNGNQPMDLEQMAEELGEKRGRRIYPDALRRMLENDNYYGLRRVNP